MEIIEHFFFMAYILNTFIILKRYIINYYKRTSYAFEIKLSISKHL